MGKPWRRSRLRTRLFPINVRGKFSCSPKSISGKSLYNNSNRVSKPNVAPTGIKSGWAIASSSLPVHITPFVKKTNIPQVLHLEISGDLPNFESSNKSIQFLLSILNSRLCPVLFNKCQRDLTQEDIYSLVNISAHRKVKTWML